LKHIVDLNVDKKNNIQHLDCI